MIRAVARGVRGAFFFARRLTTQVVELMLKVSYDGADRTVVWCWSLLEAASCMYRRES